MYVCMCVCMCVFQHQGRTGSRGVGKNPRREKVGSVKAEKRFATHERATGHLETRNKTIDGLLQPQFAHSMWTRAMASIDGKMQASRKLAMYTCIPRHQL